MHFEYWYFENINRNSVSQQIYTELPNQLETHGGRMEDQNTKTDFSIQAYGKEKFRRPVKRWHETITSHVAYNMTQY
jgi:hypothetical protein